MAKKYLSLEEAANQLKLSPDELIRLREKGDIRGFADRGTFKFRSEDVDEYARRSHPDSAPEVPILDDTEAAFGPVGDSSLLMESQPEGGDEDTEIRQSDADADPISLGPTSDSDVRLILDDSLAGSGDDSDPDVQTMGDSDSDVRLTDEPAGVVDSGSDSDVKLVGSDSDSDVTLAAAPGAEDDASSDSDVKLVGSDTESDVRLSDSGLGDSGSDSDVRLVGEEDLAGLGSDSDVRLATENAGSSDEASGSSVSDVALVSPDGGSSVDEGSSVDSSSSSDDASLLLSEDSGIMLEGGDSSVQLKSESGITLEDLADSGISLERDDDSGISLERDEDSGIALDMDDDSGIAIGGVTDSGIALDDAADSGIRLDVEDSSVDEEGHRTVPLLDLDDDDGDDTQMDVPSLTGSSDSGDEGDTNVILFDEDEFDDEVGGDSGRAGAAVLDDDTGEDFAEIEDFGDDADLGVAEEVMGEEEEDFDEVPVFDAADEDFAEDFETGESHPEFAPPSGPIARVPAAAIEVDWGTGTLVLLACSTLLMGVCAAVAYDLVRTMWSANDANIASSALLSLFGNRFGG